tara:strand:- start:270 stop:1073 length:804 start_codon:yes stop_codon:yes gene_type:complete
MSLLPERSYRDYWLTHINYHLDDIVIVDPNKPNVWFFGDSFCRWPKDNIWKPITDKCNLVHHGSAGHGIEACLAQILACKHFIKPNDRVVIVYSHYKRDAGRLGDRWAWTEKGTTYTPHYTRDKIENKKELEEAYKLYKEEIEWESSQILRNHIYKNYIESMDFGTPYVTSFKAFSDENDTLKEKWIPEETLKELIHQPRHKDGTAELDFWSWIHHQEDTDLKSTSNILDRIGERHESPNHFMDYDVEPFWVYYKDRLDKLNLEELS